MQDNCSINLSLYIFFKIEVQIVQHNNVEVCEKSIIDYSRSRLQLLSIDNLLESICRSSNKSLVDRYFVDNLKTNKSKEEESNIEEEELSNIEEKLSNIEKEKSNIKEEELKVEEEESKMQQR